MTAEIPIGSEEEKPAVGIVIGSGDGSIKVGDQQFYLSGRPDHKASSTSQYAVSLLEYLLKNQGRLIPHRELVDYFLGIDLGNSSYSAIKSRVASARNALFPRVRVNDKPLIQFIQTTHGMEIGITDFSVTMRREQNALPS